MHTNLRALGDINYAFVILSEAIEILSKMFDEDDELQNVYYDENSAQKNL
ncbi:MAG: hypothetical protein K2L70_08260 [Clostridia bacterium]|nr:hypothetical protein [Clostridia bacterium]